MNSFLNIFNSRIYKIIFNGENIFLYHILIRDKDIQIFSIFSVIILLYKYPVILFTNKCKDISLII